MNSAFKKILVLLPVIILGIFYFKDHTELYRNSSGKRLVLFAITLLLLYGWIFLEVLLRKQISFLSIVVQSSFYVYMFMVLTLTGYFILFREISVHDWWHNMVLRIERKDRVNLELFKIFRIYGLSNTQIIGNFIMLIPFGIYFPLLYKKLSNFFIVIFFGLLLSVSIEFLQLITRYRSTDVDDVLLNTLGVVFGFMIYKVISTVANPNMVNGTQKFVYNLKR